jgi:hypothetical protein
MDKGNHFFWRMLAKSRISELAEPHRSVDESPELGFCPIFYFEMVCFVGEGVFMRGGMFSGLPENK